MTRAGLHSRLQKTFDTHERTTAHATSTTQQRNMYGFFSLALEKLVRRRFGDEKWEEICELAGVSLGNSCSFQVHHMYDDRDIQHLIQTAADVLGFDQPTLLELFGEQFLLWCREYGQSQTLKLLGRSLQDFLANLDSLHDHVSTLYPQMIPPSFRCSPGRETNVFFLHYHSQRDGLEHLVVGLVKAISREYFKMEVRISLVTKKGDDGCDHSVFSVQEVAHYERNPMEEALRFGTPNLYSDKQLVTPEVFSKAFPFHIIFDRNLRIEQCGATLSVLLSSAILHDSSLPSHFTLDHPLMKFTFDAILSHINTFFVLRMTTQVSSCKKVVSKFVMRSDADPLSLRGQMIYLRESDSLLFLCSPRVKQLHDLERAGLYLSDIPLHDATRGLLMIGKAAESEYINSVRLEELIIKLQSVQKSLEEEKQRMASLLREMLPITVADSLMAGQMVEAERFECVTILFSDIVEFTSICSRSEPMEIVNMLNKLYSCFDQCVDQNQVYKVETIGDAYMVVGGLPQRNTTHAECVANQALDMMYYCRRVCRPDNGKPITMRVGIHSGKVVAGIVGVRMPRYCLFGNTVNIASRTESNGVPGRIQVTEHTYNLLKQNPQLSFTYRGPMEFKNVPDPIPCYFLLENSAKSKPTPVTVPFSEDLIPGYDLFTRPSPFLSTGLSRSSSPPTPATKYSTLLTVPSLSQDDPETPPLLSPCRSYSSTSSTSTVQSRGDELRTTTICNLPIPNISIGDGPGQKLIVPVPNISVTTASSSPSPVSNSGADSCEPVSGGRGEEVIKEVESILTHLKYGSQHCRPSEEESGEERNGSVTPESPLVSVPQATLVERRLTKQLKRRERLTNRGNLSPLTLSESCPFGSGGEGGRGHEGVFLRSARERRERELDSVSSMSPLREEATEDSLYSSFEGSEISDQEPEERRQRGEEGRKGRERERQKCVERWRETRRKGETVQPKLLTVGRGVRVTVGAADVTADGGGLSDGTEDTSENIPVRKISDCSNRSVDSGTKMSEVSKDEDDCPRKLSDLSEASFNTSEIEGEEERNERRVGSGGTKSENSATPSPVQQRERSGSVHNKVDFFNNWIQQHQTDLRQVSDSLKKKRSRLLRTQSEMVFRDLSAVPLARRGSLLPWQQDAT